MGTIRIPIFIETEMLRHGPIMFSSPSMWHRRSEEQGEPAVGTGPTRK